MVNYPLKGVKHPLGIIYFFEIDTISLEGNNHSIKGEITL